MERIPTYALYGEYKENPSADWVHCETIQSRSRLHNYTIQPHRHENLFQILHLTHGEAQFVIDNRQVTLHAPCIVTLPPMMVHGYTFPPDVEGTVLTLFESRMAQILQAASTVEATFREVRLIPLADLADAVARDIASITAEFEGRSPGRLGVIEARLALIFITLHRILGDAASDAPRLNDRALQHVRRFRQLVDQDFRKHQPVVSYARRLGLTATHLNRICREHLGETALGVIHERIVLEAKRYLTFTSLTAKEIALALAFDDPSYFNRFFKQKTGLSPLAFRALQKTS